MAPRPCRQVTLPALLAAVGFLFLVALAPPAGSMPREELADTVERVRPAVVSIAATNDLRLGANGDFERSEDPKGYGEVATLGAGVLIDPTGYIVTSGHITENAQRLQVTLIDGRTFDATFVGLDEETDLAVLKIAASSPFAFVSWGDSDAVRVGDVAIAIGNPFGLEGSVTAGIVSARGRALQVGELADYLQVDAPIQRGNSGGPLFDRLGRVIGINSLLYTSDGSSIGIGFALPSAIAQPAVEALKRHGRVDRGWLGARAQEITPEIAAGLGLGSTLGALVLQVDPKSPADRAGIRPGDVILAVESRRVERHRDLIPMIAALEPDRVVTLDLWRDGKAMAATPRLARLGVAEPPVPPLLAPAERRPPAGVLGLALQALDPEARRKWLVPDDVRGAVVVAVVPGSAAADAAVLAGDVVVRIGNTAVDVPADLESGVTEATRAGRAAALLLIYRRGNERFVGVVLRKE